MMKCPKCGSTVFQVESLDLVEQTYDATTGEWSPNTLLDDTYIVQVRCAECGTELPPTALEGYPTTRSIFRDFCRVVVVYPWPSEGGVLVGVDDEFKLVYRRPPDAGPYAPRPEAVAGDLIDALGIEDFRRISFAEFALATRGETPRSWQEVPEIVATIVRSDHEEV